MSIKADQHMHSHHSGDSNASMNKMVLQSISIGLEKICFTEHMDLDYPYDTAPDVAPGSFTLDTDAYKNELDQMRRRYSDQIDIGFGVEVGMQYDTAIKNSRYVKSYPFDMVIASIHVCEHTDLCYPSFFKGRSKKDALTAFFNCTLDNVRIFDDYDILGHLDYAVRYAPGKHDGYYYSDYSGITDDILRIIIKKGKGLDLNTKPFRQGMTQINPSTALLERYHELGGRIITFGSDAHFQNDIASDFDKAAQIALSCGFTQYCTFSNRNPEFHDIV